MVQFSLLFLQSANVNTMSKKRRRDKMEEPTPVWKIVTEHPDIFNTHVMTKLNGNDVKFFYDVNPESRSGDKTVGSCPIPDTSRLEILTQHRPYLGLSGSVLKRRNDFVHKWL